MIRLIIICIGVLLIVGTSWADPIQSYTPVLTGGMSIDFEGFAEGTLISTQFPGVTFGQHDGGTPMIDNYDWLYAYGASSGSAVLTGSTTGGAPWPTIAGITVTLDSPVPAVQAFLSDTAPLGDYYTVSAYDASDALLESFTVAQSETGGLWGTWGAQGRTILPPPGSTPLPGIYVGFTRSAADISWFQIGPSSYYPGDAFAIDDVTIIPVPGAVLLGILGLGVAGLKLRKFA